MRRPDVAWVTVDRQLTATPPSPGGTSARSERQGALRICEAVWVSRGEANLKSKKSLPKTLPETLPGAVCLQRVCCGKPNCHCARGQKHVAFYRFWWEDGRQRKEYVRRADLRAVRAACRRNRDQVVGDRSLLRNAKRAVQFMIARLQEMAHDGEESDDEVG
jgi:hypothetical protein